MIAIILGVLRLMPTALPATIWEQHPLQAFPAALRASARGLVKAAGSPIFLTGQRPQWMYFVAAGIAVMSRTHADGQAVIMQRASLGFLAEASLSSPKYHCDAHGLTRCELIAFPMAALRNAIDTEPGVRWAWISMLAAETRRQRLNVERMAFKTVRDRLLHLLGAEAQDGKAIFAGTKRELARELGVTHEALYRTIAALKREGVLIEDRLTLRVRGPIQLRARKPWGVASN
jgi:CRP/FNR family transcriptional regulator, dissimilatory nitrate respiration regulator